MEDHRTRTVIESEWWGHNPTEFMRRSIWNIDIPKPGLPRAFDTFPSPGSGAFDLKNRCRGVGGGAYDHSAECRERTAFSWCDTRGWAMWKCGAMFWGKYIWFVTEWPRKNGLTKWRALIKVSVMNNLVIWKTLFVSILLLSLLLHYSKNGPGGGAFDHPFDFICGAFTGFGARGRGIWPLKIRKVKRPGRGGGGGKGGRGEGGKGGRGGRGGGWRTRGCWSFELMDALGKGHDFRVRKGKNYQGRINFWQD